MDSRIDMACFLAWLFFLLWVITYLANVDSYNDTLFTFLLRFTPFTGPASSASRQPCKPDGSFSPYTDKYNWWSSDGFFQITLKIGSLTFNQAKAIDVVWDVVCPPSLSAVIRFSFSLTFCSR